MKTSNPHALGRARRLATRGLAVALAAVGLTAVAAVVSTHIVKAGASSTVAEAPDPSGRITLNHNQVLV